MNDLHSERGGELGDRVPGARMPDDQPAAARAQRGVELAHAVPDEFDAAVVRRGQRIEDLAIEDERAVDRARVPERVAEGRMVEVAQVAPEPDERTVVHALGHVREPCRPGKRSSLARSSWRHNNAPAPS